MIATGTDARTIYIEDAQEVYPCRCGETHRGDYGLYDYGHHECLHATDLLLIGDQQALCPDCGRSWGLEDIEK